MCKTSSISSYFIKKSIQEGNNVTPMKLIKLIYIAHGFKLALDNGNPLLDEAVMAWKYGPVIKSVYQAYKHFGKDAITQPDGGNYDIDNISEKSMKIMDLVWEVYKDYSGLQLSTLTHQSGTPWDITCRTIGENSMIPENLIRNHYQTIVEHKLSSAS
jgi:uncharacterized phage-associated protein